MWGHYCWQNLMDTYSCEKCGFVNAEGTTISTTQNQNAKFITFDSYNVT